MEEADLPYVAEYAKSGRASCKGCKGPINKDELRFGIMIQSPHFDGKVPLWHHFKCFFMKKTPPSTGDIRHFASLRWEDQKRIKDKMLAPASSEASGSSSETAGEYSVEYAKTSRSSCKVCSEKIPKAVLRISKLEYDSETARRFGPSPAWHHVDCFVRVKDNLGFTESADKLPGFSRLDENDKDILKQKLGGQNRKKKVAVGTEEPPAKKKKEETKEKLLQSQNKLYFSFRDLLQKNLTKSEMTELLESNEQVVPSGESRILDHLADCLTFGALLPCSECNGGLRLGNAAYKCSGNVTGWTKCQYATKTPGRRKFLIPDDIKEEYTFLKAYKYVKRDRIFPPEAATASTSNGSVNPLQNFKVVLIWSSEEKKEELKEKITKLGGRVMKKIDKNITCIITSKEEAEKDEKSLKSAKKHNVLVVSEEFLDDAKNGGAAYKLKEHMLYSWGDDVSDKLFVLSANLSKSAKSLKSIPKVQKVVHGVTTVDPDSGHGHDCHVLVIKGETYNAVLGMVDIQRGINSYYKLQILKHNYHDSYYIFRSWGRVGTDIGGKKLDEHSTAENAIHSFKALYLEKTENQWSERNNFVKKPHRFYPLDIDYGQDDEPKLEVLKPGLSSKLPKSIQELICLLFDVEAMKKAMMEFEIDLQKMPLGKLSKKQIQHAYSVLSELQQLISGEKVGTKILDASNRFYTLIPHDFGMQKPPLLDTEGVIKAKTEMLESLLEIEYAYKLLNVEKSDEMDSIDQHYEQLKTDIEILDKKSDEFKNIKTYLSNTHAATHSSYSLELKEVFKINRHGELDRYTESYKDLSNKKLLWHGSRLTNFAGILSQGLRIAPPEAPSTGYMFGKGIYFADMVSKSANYCYTSRQNPTGLLLLCEVALGNMYERTTADYVTKLPDGKHSTKGIGQTMPDPKSSITVDGKVEIPFGKPVSAAVGRSSLLYNEYIVYDIKQVNIKYLLKVKFNYRW